jgi:hypothetical protein
MTAAVTAAVLLVSLSACTKSSPAPITSSSPSATPTSTLPAIQSTGPVSTGTITEKTVSSCPYLSFGAAFSDGGMRLDRITELTQAGATVGCRFYPLEHPNSQCPATCLAGEHLPPGTVPAIEIVISRFANTTNAHNAFIRIAEKGTHYEQDVIAPGNTGLCYETTLWSKDNGTDWACTFSKGVKVVVIRTVVVGSSFNVVELAKALYPKV